MTHEVYMHLALELASNGEGWVAPNPLVGAVIVKNNRIIGRGYHPYFGGPHAEINAINSVEKPEQIKGATLYLTLEPCSYFGKTPSCADAIVHSGIGQVVIATRDPNPLVRGRGVRLLKQHDINVIEGVLEPEARAINKPFFKAQQKGLPYVIAKWAMSMDGKLATRPGQSRWITSEESRDYSKYIRAQSQAVMVGIETVLKDNPGLLAWVKYMGNPIRIILDSKARLPLNSKLVKTIAQGPVWVMVSASAPENRVRLLKQKGVKVFRVPLLNGRLDFKAAMKTLVDNGINKLMIEGGSEVLGSAFYNKVVDEVYCFIAPKIIGGRDAQVPVEGKGVFRIADALQLKNVTVKYINLDVLVHGYL